MATWVVSTRTASEREETRGEVRDAVSEARDCRETSGGPFRPLPRGLGYRRLEPSEREAVGELMPSEIAPLIEVRVVTDAQGDLAVVSVAPVGDRQSQAQDGFEDAARERGVTLRPISFGDRDAVYGRFPGGVVAAGGTECDFVSVEAADLRTVRLIADRVIGGLGR